MSHEERWFRLVWKVQFAHNRGNPCRVHVMVVVLVLENLLELLLTVKVSQSACETGRMVTVVLVLVVQVVVMALVGLIEVGLADVELELALDIVVVLE